jgi:hypothetical protein
MSPSQPFGFFPSIDDGKIAYEPGFVKLLLVIRLMLI